MEREKKPENIQKVVRSVVFSLASANEIYSYYSVGASLKDENSFSLLKFPIEVKGDGNDLRYTLFGGRIEEGENFSEAIQREIVEEAGLRFYGIPNQSILGVWQYSSAKSGRREVILTYNPVLVSEKKLIGDAKIKDIRMMDLFEFSTLIQQGEFEGVPLEGHLSLRSDSPDQINIDQENKDKKNQALMRTLTQMTEVDAYLKKKFSQIFQANPNISFEEFKRQYEQIMSRFMRRGLEVAIQQKEKENPPRHELIEALDSGFLGKDILYYLPELSVHGVDWCGLPEATESTQIFVKFLKNIFSDFLEEQRLTFEEVKQKIGDPNVLLDEKTDLLNNKLNAFFIKRLMEVFGVDERDLEQVYLNIQNFFRDLSNEMKVADPHLTQGLYQDFTLINEVDNANYGRLLSLFLGMDTKKISEEAEKLIRFEAGRQLVLLLKGLVGVKHYFKAVELNRKSGRLKEAINTFFSAPVREEIVDLGENQKMKIRIRQRNGIDFVVDEKPIKTFTSFLRKSFYEKTTNINDFNSVSVVFHDLNHNNIDASKKLGKDFIQYLFSQFPTSVIDVKDERTYGTANFENFKSNSETIGKRIGSQSDRLVRTKLIISLDDEKLELTIYPFFSLKGTQGNFWGWLEKISDDKNYVVRRLLAGVNGIPSFYDLMFPPDFYPRHYEHRLNSIYHK
jgi:8-oxo-dGTP pyrophosphatase MutT (NUDIX family)